MKRGLITFICLLSCLWVAGQSIFSSGTWYKIGVTEDGIYKIDRDFISNTLKINVSSLDPRTIKLYGKGGGLLPQENSSSRYSDPPELAIYASGEGDGAMDTEDYFLFYGQSPHRIHFDAEGNLQRGRNFYSDTTYYFLTYGDTPGKRMETQQNGATIGPFNSTFPDFVYHELDETNLIKSGREWFGEAFGSGQGFATELTFSFDLQGIGSSLNFYSALIGASEGDCSFDIYYNDDLLDHVEIDSIATDRDDPLVIYSDRGILATSDLTITNVQPSFDLRYRFNKSPTQLITSRGYLDYFLLNFERSLVLYGNYTFFRSRDGVTSFEIITSEPAPLVWDLADAVNPKIQLFQKTATGLTFTGSISDLNEYVILSPTDLPAPDYFGEIGNQNLKALTNLDGVIITHPLFRSEAERLAAFHRAHDQLEVTVVTPQEIYNEFSSGMQDLTAIRDYLRYVKDAGNTLKYACLFGDASYDYKRRESVNTNFVPAYESRDSFHKIFSYSSDDFIGFLEEDEGDWIEQRSGDHTLDIGVGRLPVKTLEEATLLVDKIIRYATSPSTFGKWRTKVVYMADDGDSNQHMKDVEHLQERISSSNPEYEVKRLFLDNYAQEEEGNNIIRSPEMQRSFKEQIKNGALIVDYLGHGNPTVLMEEQVITRQLVDELSNRHKLPMMVTATCDFGKYDDPGEVSGAEIFLLHPSGGAIGLLTTTRAVYSSTNRPLNEAFHDYVFQKIGGKYPRLGDVVRETKNNGLAGPVNRNFALLGDPMLQLNYPELTISFDGLESETDTLSALEHVTLKGEVRRDSINREDTFSGTATITVLDIPQEQTTRGQESAPFTYYEQVNALFRGEVTVDSGAFEVQFIIPKNTSYKYQNGKILAYAFDNENLIDASGASTNFVLGGTAPAASDLQPPTISLYLNEPSFQSGGTVGSGSLLIAKIFDAHGINLSANGFDQGIFLSLNDEEPFNINEFYTADKDTYKSGTLTYPLQDLPAGKYTATIKLKDAYNNAAIAQVEFKVSDQPKIRVYNLINYPNPVSALQETRFVFEHDREGEGLKIRLSIFDSGGNLVNSREFLNDESPRLIDDITWIPASDGGQPIRGGIYFYRLEVKSNLDGASNESVGRMIIHN